MNLSQTDILENNFAEKVSRMKLRRIKTTCNLAMENCIYNHKNFKQKINDTLVVLHSSLQICDVVEQNIFTPHDRRLRTRG